jgi:hypothetical protein
LRILGTAACLLILGNIAARTSLLAVEVTLAAPITTIVPLSGVLPSGGKVFTAVCTVPADAPADLGVGAFVTDHHGRWFQRLRPGVLSPGVQPISITIGDDDPATGSNAPWDASQSATTIHGGLFFWSASASRAVLDVAQLRATALTRATIPRVTTDRPRLSELRTSGTSGHTGERWQLTCQPQPFPRNPFDPAEFSLDLVVTAANGTTQRIPGFAELPMQGHDRGDREEVLPIGRTFLCARWRPCQPGLYHLRLEARWNRGTAVVSELPPVTVGGPPWDAYVRVDPVDKRFFTVAGEPFWPVGPNLRAITDIRCTERMRTKVTPDRGTLAYADFFARLAPHGVNAAEIWLSAWNLALEWRGDWPEFAGLGRYSQERAWRLDRILDLAWQNGIRLNIVINNHGQASDSVDREWHNNPYRRENGGFLDNALQYFTAERALAQQDALRRYLAARYADHPAILGWKLWSEQDLTAAGRQRQTDVLAAWHTQAAERWKTLDTYGHPLTTHWSGSFRSVFPAVAALPGIDFLTIDAYHDTFEQGRGQLLAHLLNDSTGRRGGLSMRYKKPTLVSEFGGQWDACPEAQMIAEHASAGFCALVSGGAGNPMLWWFEWIDQGDRFQPYAAITGFLRGEDLRAAAGQPPGQSLTLEAADGNAGSATLWCRAWSRTGRILGYVLDERWQADGGKAPELAHTAIVIGEQINPGRMGVSWWDADTGIERSHDDFTHPGGELRLTAPPWSRHLAFKLWRQ